jgi:hypothetical protein
VNLVHACDGTLAGWTVPSVFDEVTDQQVRVRPGAIVLEPALSTLGPSRQTRIEMRV